MLTAAIMFDNGRQSLQDRIEELKNIVVNNIIPALPGTEHAMTVEEHYVQMALRGRKIHARAKMIIMQMLQQIKNPNKVHKGPRQIFKRDYTKATVTQMFTDMLDIIRKENPAVAEQIMKEGQDASHVEDTGANQAMEEDLAVDNSLEAKIEREVKRLLRIIEKNLESNMKTHMQDT